MAKNLENCIIIVFLRDPQITQWLGLWKLRNSNSILEHNKKKWSKIFTF